MQTIARAFWKEGGATTGFCLFGCCGRGVFVFVFFRFSSLGGAVLFLLVWFHAYIPWWAMIFLGGYVIAWQFSLQHETIHAFRGVPKWFRTLIAMPPLGLWFPYPMYRRSHTIHHRNTYLTVPGQDTETYYVKRADWERMGKIERGILLFNQT